MKAETRKREDKLVERKGEREPRIEVLGKMSELMRGKNGGADAKPTARQS